MPLKGVYTPYETAQVQKAVDYIDTHHTESISIDRLIEDVRLDRKVFRQIFSKTTGFTVHNYLLKLRIERATEDLVNFQLTVKQVAYRHGFSSGGHFAKKFKEQKGISPTDYRLQIIMSKEGICATIISPDFTRNFFEPAKAYR